MTPGHNMAHLLLNSGLALDLSHLEAALQARRSSNTAANLAFLTHHHHQLEVTPPPTAAPTNTTTTTTGSAAALAALAIAAQQQQQRQQRQVQFPMGSTALQQQQQQIPTTATNISVVPKLPQQQRLTPAPPQAVVAPPSSEESEEEEDSVPEAPQPVVEPSGGSSLSSSSSSGKAGRVPQKRNPNDLETAAPVTCLDDFVRLPITTTLNNLKVPRSSKGSRRAAASWNHRRHGNHGGCTLTSSQKKNPHAPPRLGRRFPSHYLPREYDVVVDMPHYPNSEFQAVIRQSLPNYLTANFQKRQSLIATIKSAVSSSGGHFIRYCNSSTTPATNGVGGDDGDDEASSSWMEVEKNQAERFIAQALQEAASKPADVVVAAVSKRPCCSSSSSPTSKRVSLPGDHRSSVSSSPGGFYGEVSATAGNKRRRSSTEKRASFTVASRALHEIPVTFRRRPSQVTAPPPTVAADRSATLSIKFKRPRTSSSTTPRKVSLETNRNSGGSTSNGGGGGGEQDSNQRAARAAEILSKHNPLQFLSEIAALDSADDDDDDDESGSH
mmetsp:Transcript_5342/g.15080  ORF Transcript_5342/g.15080 Transcript_5342/m.15080 type:complete len:554 (-) Transcript_5342:149-1810(-)